MGWPEGRSLTCDAPEGRSGQLPTHSHLSSQNDPSSSFDYIPSPGFDGHWANSNVQQYHQGESLSEVPASAHHQTHLNQHQTQWGGYYNQPHPQQMMEEEGTGRRAWMASTYALVPVQCVVMQTGPPIYCSPEEAAKWGYNIGPSQSGQRPGRYRSHQLSKVRSQPSSSLEGRSIRTAYSYSNDEAESSSAISVEETGSSSSLRSSWRRSLQTSATGTSASSRTTASSSMSHTEGGLQQLQDAVSTGWGDLTVSILQAVLNMLSDGDNKHVRQVCRHWRMASDQSLEALTPTSLRAKTVTMRFPNLRLLHLTNCQTVRNRDLQNLSSSRLRLHTLVLGDDINKPWVTNVGLSSIGKITSLTSLSLQDCTQVTNRGLVSLAPLQALSALSLRGCSRLSNQGLEALQANTGLTSLNLAGCRKISDKGLVPLIHLRGLLQLALGNTKVGDEGMQYISEMTSLHELQFAGEQMTNAGITQLSTLTNLQTLALRECPQVTGDALSELVPKLHNLQSLDLFQSYQFDDSQLGKCLDFLGSVTYLDLRGTVVSEEGIQQLASLQNLQKLCLSPKRELRVEHHLCVVSHLTQLTSLTINNCRLVSFDLMKSLMHLKLLRELDISNSSQVARQEPEDGAAVLEPVNPQAIEAVAQISSLTSVDLSRRLVHEEHLTVLAERLPRLRSLVVVGCPVLLEKLQDLHRRFPELVIHRKPVHDHPMSCTTSDHGL